MTRKEWLSAINKIDDKYINELADYQLKKRASGKKTSKEADVILKPKYFRPDSSVKSGIPFKKVMIAAAAVVCVVAMGIFIRINNKPQTLPPNDSMGALIGDSVDSNSTISFPDGIVNKKLDNVTFNFKINSDRPTELPKIKLKAKQLDSGILKNAFLSGKTITDTLEIKLMGGGKQTTYKTSDKCVLLISPNFFNFSDSSIGDTSKNFGTVANYYDKYCNSNSEELAAFSRTDAVQRVNKILDEVGVENYGEPYVIPVSSEMANSYLEENGGFSKEEGANKNYTLWEQDEGLYVLKYKFNFGGTDISNKDLKAVGSSKTIYGAGITAFVTKDNIFYLDVKKMYDGEFVNAGTIELKFSAKDAANELIEYYSKQIVEDPKCFTECKLEYVPLEQASDSEVIFTPAWRFAGYEILDFEDENDVIRDCVEYYYADTGIRYGSY